MAKANPEAHLPNVATTLNNLTNLYHAAQSMQEPSDSCAEALSILEPLWQLNPELHGDQLARVNFVVALLAEQSSEACKFVRQALAAACDPSLRQSAQKLIDRFCGHPIQ